MSERPVHLAHIVVRGADGDTSRHGDDDHGIRLTHSVPGPLHVASTGPIDLAGVTRAEPLDSPCVYDAERPQPPMAFMPRAGWRNDGSLIA